MISPDQIITGDDIRKDADLRNILYAYHMAYPCVVPQGPDKVLTERFNKTQTELLCVSFGLLVRKYKRLVPINQMSEQEIEILDAEVKRFTFEGVSTNQKRQAMAVLCYLCDLYLTGELFTT
jgi:hypothetical protein